MCVRAYIATDTGHSVVKAWGGRERAEGGKGEKSGEHVCSLNNKKIGLDQGRF